MTRAPVSSRWVVGLAIRGQEADGLGGGDVVLWMISS